MSGTTAKLGLVTLVDADLARTALNTHWNTNAAKLDDAATAGPSLLVNGGLEVWQRGNGPFTTNGLMTADRWIVSLTAGTVSVSRDSANADTGSLYCAAVAFTFAGGTNQRLQQALEDYAQLRGRTLTVAARVKASAASAVRVGLWDSVNGFRYSGYHTGGGAYETLTVTAPIAAAATGVQVGLHLEASGTVYLDNTVLGVGSVVAPYAPLHPALELLRCQRYYAAMGGQ